jgi:hypothetical protein
MERERTAICQNRRDGYNAQIGHVNPAETAGGESLSVVVKLVFPLFDPSSATFYLLS